MPFETFICLSCKKKFSDLYFSGRKNRCPNCGSSRTEKESPDILKNKFNKNY